MVLANTDLAFPLWLLLCAVSGVVCPLFMVLLAVQVFPCQTRPPGTLLNLLLSQKLLLLRTFQIMYFLTATPKPVISKRYCFPYIQ